MTRKQLPYFVAFLVLMFGAVACACLGSGTGIGGIQATANAAFTQAAAGAATAGAGAATAGAAGNSALATAKAEATHAQATANASGSNGGATQEATQAEATATGTGGNGTIKGGPKDIPIVSGDNTVLVANNQVVSYQTKVPFATVVKFYQDEMPKNGWTVNKGSSIVTSSATVLAFTKDTRQALVTLTPDPTSEQTIVLITIQ